MRVLLVALTFVIMASTNATADTLITWDGGSGTTLSGWTYGQDPGQQGYTVYGWAEDSGSYFSGAWWDRIIQKTDYYDVSTNAALMEIVTDSTMPTGDEALKVYEDAQIGDGGGPGFWYVPMENSNSSGAASATDNRIGFYIRLDGLNTWNPTSPIAETVHFGLYTGWANGVEGNTAEEYEEASAQLPASWISYVATNGGTTQAGHHYYHTMGMPGGAWMHVALDQHPTHARTSSNSGKPVNNPTAFLYPGLGLNYMQAINRFYLEIRYPQDQKSQLMTGPMDFYTVTQDENEESITSLYVGYYPDTGKWSIGWQDMSFYHVSPYSFNSTTQSAFEIRWSTSPITNENYTSATVVEPEYHERGTTNHVIRSNTWIKNAWTQFDLPVDAESNAKLYFAVLDVSTVAAGDGREASSPYIKTIDYTLSVSTWAKHPWSFSGAQFTSN